MTGSSATPLLYRMLAMLTPKPRCPVCGEVVTSLLCEVRDGSAVYHRGPCGHEGWTFVA